MTARTCNKRQIQAEIVHQPLNIGSLFSHNTFANSGFFAPPFRVSDVNKSAVSCGCVVVVGVHVVVVGCVCGLWLWMRMWLWLWLWQTP